MSAIGMEAGPSIGVVSAAAFGVVLGGCGGALPARAEAPPLPAACATATESSAAEWKRARERLSELRLGLRGSGPHTLRLSVKLREPFLGRVMEARGAVALSPPSALRMILLGPGGTTALDLWVRDDSFRFAVPAIDLMRRGDASTPREQMRGLPVDFLKWWLLRPAEGTLLWHGRGDGADRFVIRDGRAIVDLCALDDGSVAARRTVWGKGGGAPSASGDLALLDEESIAATRRGCGPVRYTQASTGLEVAVVCEGEETSRAPNPRAFVDPDDASGGGGE
jgi:hypothetical protein